MIQDITIQLSPEQLDNQEIINNLTAYTADVKLSDINKITYVKRSLDCRHKAGKYSLQMKVYSGEDKGDEEETLKIAYIPADEQKKVIIVGAGPAGYFAALELLERGIKPIIFERGDDVSKRPFAIKDIHQAGKVNPDSNYCFGEGGAGTYSDGKLYTRSNKRGNVSKVLQIFVDHGADSDIMLDAQPHIGSNRLPKIIAEIRKTILDNNGEVYFNSRVTDLIIKNNQIAGVTVNGENDVLADYVILATGHSARDIYYLLNDKKIQIESKPYALGFRIEHPQELINELQYGKNHHELLPPAVYRLVAQSGNRGVFTFCMCPGGYIIPAVTGSEELVVNGMSNEKRNSRYANSGIVTTVDAEDFQEFAKHGALAGLKFQESMERKFYMPNPDNLIKAPGQRLTDFLENKPSRRLNDTSYQIGVVNSEMYNMFPEQISKSLQDGITQFGRKLPGYISSAASVIGLESRTSSPVRIPRDKASLEHLQIKGLYPCGEGSGYAGGIVSSAIDGQNVAKAIAGIMFND
jgi:uncharacterized protein